MNQIVVGTWYRKAQGRQHLAATEADVKRKNMVVHVSFADEMNENAKSDKQATDTFVVDEKATEKYNENAKTHKEDLDNKSKMLAAEKTGGLAELVRMAAGNKSNESVKAPSKKTALKDAIKEERIALFDEAKSLGLKVAKNIKTDDLKERVANGREIANEEEE